MRPFGPFLWGVLALTLGALATPGATQAQSAAGASLDDLRGILPYMMLVVDTSGSMERLPACTCTTPGCEECLPNCSLNNGAAPTYAVPAGKKNRWAVTLEALTGTFIDYECEPLSRTIGNGMTYDLGYYLPYHQPWDCTAAGSACAYGAAPGQPLQEANGILDEYRTRVQFGLMTFDGWDTYVGAPPLVPASDFNTNLSEAVQGLWSYGGGKTFHYPNCTTDYMMDTGARSPIAAEGSLVSLDSCNSTPCPSWCALCPNPNQLSINTDIQEALLATRPYGGTPIAASLDDLYHHLKNDLSDVFGSCRNRYALLITDGYPDDDYRSFGCNCREEQDSSDPNYCGGPSNDPLAMHCPYPTAEDAARDLVQGRTGDNPMLEQLFVVGLAISDAQVLARLNAIADNGCPYADCATNGGDQALFADNLPQLIDQLSDIIEGAIEPISRSVPVFAAAGPLADARQYQVSTGFEVPLAEGDPWTGIVERRRFLCQSGNLVEAAIETRDRFHETLVGKMRDLRTVTWDDVNFNGDGERCVSGVCTPISGEYLFRGTGVAAGCGSSGCAETPLSNVDREELGLDPDENQLHSDILEWMYSTGNSTRVNRPMGDIFHSSPVAVGPPEFDIADEAYNAFRQLDVVRNRPRVLYVGSNDGILHAFSLEEYSGEKDYSEGEEMWGFVPPLLIDDLEQNLLSHQFTMDGTPVVKDVYFNRAGTASADPTDYHTVLITGMRGGGKAYIALDVTDPLNPVFLWQFTDPAMGWTYAQPAITQATYIFDNGVTSTTKNGAIAILPGGKGELGPSGVPNDCTNGVTNAAMRNGTAPFQTFDQLPGGTPAPLRHRDDVQCWRDMGRALFFVDVETGRLIKKIHRTSTGNMIFPSPLVSTPALFQDQVGTKASRAFITDMDGVIWRVDLNADDQDRTDPFRGWVARPFHDIFWDNQTSVPGEFTYEAPLISLDDEGRLVVITGTGDGDVFSDATANHRVVSVTEVIDPDLTGTVGPGHYKAAMNWEQRVKPTDGLVTSEMVTGTMEIFNKTVFYGTFIVVQGGGDACDLGRGRLHAVHYRNRKPDDSNPGTSPTTYGPELVDVAGDTAAASVINISANSAIENFMVMGLNITQRPSCTVVDTQNFDVWNQSLPAITELSDPAIYLVAQATGNMASGSLIQQRSGSRFGSIEVKLDRGEDANSSTSRIVSWATSVD